MMNYMGLETYAVYWYSGEHPHRDGGGKVCPASHGFHLKPNEPAPPITMTLPCHACYAPAVTMSRGPGVTAATGTDPNMVLGAV
jgi:hypothetical protein